MHNAKGRLLRQTDFGKTYISIYKVECMCE